MKKQFRDNQQLILTMYNIALVYSTIFIVANVVDLYQGTMRIFLSIGVFWMTVFSCCVFVLPKLLQIRSAIGPGTAAMRGYTPNALQNDNASWKHKYDNERVSGNGAKKQRSLSESCVTRNPSRTNLNGFGWNEGRGERLEARGEHLHRELTSHSLSEVSVLVANNEVPV